MKGLMLMYFLFIFHVRKSTETLLSVIAGSSLTAQYFHLPHFLNNFRKANCAYCHDRIWGLGRQGFKCIQCKLMIHKKCHKLYRVPCDANQVGLMPGRSSTRHNISDAPSSDITLPPPGNFYLK